MNLITGLSKSFSAVQSFFLGLSQVIGQAHNCALTCMCHCIFISLTVLGTTRVVLGVSTQLEDLIDLNLSRVLGKFGNTIAHHCCDCCIGILLAVWVSCFGQWTVCSPSGILWKTSTRVASICVGTKCQQFPKQPSQTEILQAGFLANALSPMLWDVCLPQSYWISPVGAKKASTFCQVHLMGQFLF